MNKLVTAAVFYAVCGAEPGAWGQAPAERVGGRIDLPTSKQIVGVVPGRPQRTNSLPVAMAVSPDGRYVVTVNGGFGSAESNYEQSLSVMDTQTGRLTDVPDARTLVESKQVLFSGLAFSADGTRLYGTIVSASDPEGKTGTDTGSGIQVYGFADGKVTRERVMKIAPQMLAAGRKTKLIGGVLAGVGLPYPAGIAVVPGAGPVAGAERLLVADELSDDVLLMDAGTGTVQTRFDVSENDAVPSTYPLAVVVSKDGRKGYVALSNASELVELDLSSGKVGRKLAMLKGSSAVSAGSHPSSLALSPDGGTLYASLANRDAVAAVEVARGVFALRGYFDARLPGQTYYGAQPEALAVSADGGRLYCANMGSDAVAVMDTAALKKFGAAKGRKAGGMVEPLGFVPTEWLPMAVAVTGGKLYVATGKGTGTGPNNFAQAETEATKGKPRMKRDFTYIATLLHGSLAVVGEKDVEREMKALTAETLIDNRMRAGAERLQFAGGGGSRIKHVIYIIKENRTYDQVFGDLQRDGKKVGNGDGSLTMYGADITPNQHKLALQFGVLDNFFDSGEVSGDGHVWSNAAIGSDYLERSWELNYRGREHGYDFEGVVSQGYPILQNIPDVNEPGSGYLWGNLAAHGKTLYHFGEYISSEFCNEKKGAGAVVDSQEGPMLEGKSCSVRNEVKPGEPLPEVWGGTVNKWPWAIPLLSQNVATKPELVGHFAAEAPDFNLRVPDQVRTDIFLRHLAGWVADRAGGRDTMPNFVMLRLANDHTAGTTPGGPTPKSSVADNDLAVGRAVEAVSHTKYWDDTAFFILEDDAQNGADHVDAHRSLGLIVSKYAPHDLVDSRFYSTVSMIRTMETALGLPPMNNNDAFSSLISTEFSGPGDQPAFVADVSNRENGLIYEANKKTAPGAAASSKMDFRHADRADGRKLNVILWRDAMGDRVVPPMLTEKRKTAKDDDD